MKTMGFAISTKENEKRRALLPSHIKSIRNKDYLYFEKGYGIELGYADADYAKLGVHIVSKEEILDKDIICDPKIGDANYLENLKIGQTLFGWIHAVQNKAVTDILLKKQLTAIAWEDMFYKGRHVFWRNNELAGEASAIHAFTWFGKLPYDCKVAIIGKGSTAKGAHRIISALGAEVIIYDKKTTGLLREEIANYDVIVNAVLWDISRKDHLIYEEDLLKMKHPSMIIDVSCDNAGAIETSIPTTIESPVYFKNDVLHYVVDHTPAIISHAATQHVGNEIVKYIDSIIESNVDSNKALRDAVIMEKGTILDKKIIHYQNR